MNFKLVVPIVCLPFSFNCYYNGRILENWLLDINPKTNDGGKASRILKSIAKQRFRRTPDVYWSKLSCWEVGRLDFSAAGSGIHPSYWGWVNTSTGISPLKLAIKQSCLSLETLILIEMTITNTSNEKSCDAASTVSLTFCSLVPHQPSGGI